MLASGIRLCFVAALTLVPAVLASGPARAEWVLVRRVMDGDTFMISTGTKVRVMDIDTPETHHPDKGREPGGEEATRLAKFFLQGNYVWLEDNATDKFGRRLARVQLPGGAWYGDIVRSHGYDKRTRRVYAQGAPGQAPIPLQRNPYRYNSAEMVWVKGHYRKDGTWVPGHYRKKTPKPSDTHQ
ncbi:MAG TPA: thermonuclease family protein [Burkholderiales bacterium]|nr:thermonuclease family protein [Burkholderiales bacterium]